MNRLQGKIAIITGGSGAIGTATAERYAAEGATVVVTARTEDRASEVASRIGNNAIGLSLDVGNQESIRSCIEQVAQRFGKIDILFNNAAVTSREIMRHDTTAPELTVETWDLMMDVNVKGVMLTCKYTIPHMIRNGGGSIINISSNSALLGDNVRFAYGTSKAAVIGLTKYVAAQHGRQYIRCNAILPGGIMNADLEQAKDYVARFVPHTLIPRMGRPADIAAAAAFLAADESEYITGQAFSVDGGHLAHQPQMGDMRSIERPCD